MNSRESVISEAVPKCDPIFERFEPIGLLVAVFSQEDHACGRGGPIPGLASWSICISLVILGIISFALIHGLRVA